MRRARARRRRGADARRAARRRYEKRYDRTREDFRSKEKRKRAMGQQNRDGNYVEEEKRQLRHGGANYDS